MRWRPLDDSETAALIAELLGPDPSVAGLTTQIAERAAGNPFFAQEIVRDLADRRVLHGERGAYVCPDQATEVSVPATLQAAIAARIDRLDGVAKRTLNAAAVIGLRFGADLPAVLVGDTALTELVQAELIDQVKFTPRAEYAFHHPLIRTVAYESQLKADRAALHRRASRRDRTTRSRFSRRECGPDRRAPRSRGRSASRVWLAHARRNVVDQPRHRCGTDQLAKGMPSRRSTT